MLFLKQSGDNESSTENTPVHEKKRLNQTQSFNDMMHFLALYTNFSSEVRKQLGHEFKDFIRSCTFSGKSCLNETLYFNHVVNSAFGNCYTFSTDRKTVIPGRDYGLSMELYLDQENYLGAGLSPQAGARLVVHSGEHQALPEENGITVSPHTATSIALLEVRIKRLKLPYTTNCSTTWDHTWYGARVNGAFAYSSERCQRICLQFAFEERCNCSHPSYMDLPTGFVPCNLISSSLAYGCSTDILEEFENQNRLCSCNMDCREISYETKISTAMWPTDNYWCNLASKYSLIEECEIADHEYGGRSHHQDKLKIQNNLLKIDVYFENLRVKSVEQSPTYKVQTFVGSLGGALSLYLGITLLMLVEVMEALFRLIYGCCVHCCRRMFTPSQVFKPDVSKFHHQHRKTKIKIGSKLPQPVFFTGRFTPPHRPIIRPRYVW
ncbi:amiloride-sensitive sodium channel subunit beta-like isoform X1 [Cryptotermes secundus]|uniref:amiloride-sensitive sodium channel subunit beta-like isoform X1 n=1 Tax=Cryptotermes secundus TaxID=105785 RepID=UPI000CD7CA5C|nr:amiloride-sensitive sodium channel subunit beta-like isoform X1 [Cryptotermes secundus]